MKGEERERGKRLFREVIAENFPNLMKDMNTNIQEAHQIPSKRNSERPTLKHIISKLSKDKERLLKQ